MKRLIIFGSIFILTWLLGFTHLLSEPSDRTMTENELKSAFLYKICKFTRWSRPLKPEDPFIISIMGPTTPGNDIIIPREKLIMDKKIIIRKIKKLTDIKESHVLFITAAEAYRLDEILSYTENKDILTVGDTEGFAEKGVIINFYIENDQVKFEINREAETKSSIDLYSYLFKSGKVIETKKHE